MNLELVDLNAIDFTDQIVSKFWMRVEKQPGDGCWNWTGKMSSSGYGRLRLKSNSGSDVCPRAHRISLHLHGIELPEDMVCDHLCRNRRCVRPSHLRIVTPRDNLHAFGSLAINKVNAAKTHCLHGHEFDSFYIWKGVKKRRCMTCQKESARRRYAARKAQP